MEIQGKITKILDVVKGQKNDGSEWQKINFIVETDEEYNNLYCFEIFSVEEVANFQKFHNVGGTVKVSFNVKTNEWQGRYFTTLQAWRVKPTAVYPTAQVNTPQPKVTDEALQSASDETNNLPF